VNGASTLTRLSKSITCDCPGPQALHEPGGGLLVVRILSSMLALLSSSSETDRERLVRLK